MLSFELTRQVEIENLLQSRSGLLGSRPKARGSRGKKDCSKLEARGSR
ncbi:MAG: hypothetical protein HYZ66_10135 [Chlamydiae bacterium]|nr:hypothetical protein [Chlamydiota bacterium]